MNLLNLKTQFSKNILFIAPALFLAFFAISAPTFAQDGNAGARGGIVKKIDLAALRSCLNRNTETCPASHIKKRSYAQLRNQFQSVTQTLSVPSNGFSDGFESKRTLNLYVLEMLVANLTEEDLIRTR